MITFKQKGDYSKVTNAMERWLKAVKLSTLDRYAAEGVTALASATPKDSGLTAASWSYKIEHTGSGVTISYLNSNINKNVNIAIILQYGHGTRNGGYVQGRDYINPAIQPVFDKIANKAWEELTKL